MIFAFESLFDVVVIFSSQSPKKITIVHQISELFSIMFAKEICENVLECCVLVD